MALPSKAVKIVARLAGLERQVRYPVGTVGFVFREILPDGSNPPHEHVLRLLVSSDECQQLARHLDALASEIEAAGGTRQ